MSKPCDKGCTGPWDCQCNWEEEGRQREIEIELFQSDLAALESDTAKGIHGWTRLRLIAMVKLQLHELDPERFPLPVKAVLKTEPSPVTLSDVATIKPLKKK
jgi:hypothetical protein